MSGIIRPPLIVPVNALTLDRLQQLASNRVLGSLAGGDVEALTPTELAEILASGAGDADDVLYGDGTWGPVDNGLAPSLALTATGSNNAHSVNLSTLGNVDWCSVFNISTSCHPPRTQQLANAQHIKKGGPAWLWQGIDYVWASGGMSGLGQASSWRTMQSTASDSCAQAAVSSLQGIGLATPAGATGWGFRVAIPAPADGISRVLRIYGCQFSNIVTHTAVLTDGSATASAQTTNSTASTQLDFLTEVTYKAKYGGALIVTCFVTTNHSVGSNIRLQGASIGTV